MNHDVKNGQLQPKRVEVRVSSEQMAALVLLQRRIGDLNADMQTIGVALGCAPLAVAVEQATRVMSAAHDSFITELSRAVKIPAPEEVAGLALVKP